MIPQLSSSVAPFTLNFLSESIDGRLSTSGGVNGTRFNSAGLLVAATCPRFDYDPATLAAKGLLIEQASTNIALWSRDLTNAVWTKSNTTAALDQIGLDGVSNSASSLVATAGNGTVLQSVTHTSIEETYSVYIKRITGSGEVDITVDGGSTWTNVTSLINSTTFSKVLVAQTVTNPNFGIRIVTNGDKIAVDCNQVEALGVTYATSPIITTSASVTRTADVVTIPASSFGFLIGRPGTITVNVLLEKGQGSGASSGSIIGMSGTAGADYITYSTSNQWGSFPSANFLAYTAVSVVDSVLVKTAFAWDETLRYMSVSGASTQSAAVANYSVYNNPTNIIIGARSSSGNTMNGCVQTFSYRPFVVRNLNMLTV